MAEGCCTHAPPPPPPCARADEVIVSSEEDVVARVKEITGGEGAWGAVDAVAGDGIKELAAGVRDGGVVLVYGALAGGTGARACASRVWVLGLLVLAAPSRSTTCTCSDRGGARPAGARRDADGLYAGQVSEEQPGGGGAGGDAQAVGARRDDAGRRCERGGAACRGATCTPAPTLCTLAPPARSGERFSLDRVKKAMAASVAPAHGGKVLLEG